MSDNCNPFTQSCEDRRITGSPKAGQARAPGATAGGSGEGGGEPAKEREKTTQGTHSEQA
ncbi:MAG: hypothetical protein NVS4B3_20020 [Gemmatimonadaceae bacterium]